MTYTDIKNICYTYGINNYSINSDYSIDVSGNVSFLNSKISIFPVNFRHVSGHFTCSFSSLTTLVGGPVTVDGNYDCSYNKLISLEGAPYSVGGDFDCAMNELESIVHGPKEVSGHFTISARSDMVHIDDYFDYLYNLEVNGTIVSIRSALTLIKYENYVKVRKRIETIESILTSSNE